MDGNYDYLLLQTMHDHDLNVGHLSHSPLVVSDYRPQLTGHETFPLRYGWLKKACDAVNNKHSSVEQNSIFSGEDAIARFGVGKNMVAAIRHWAVTTGVINDAHRIGKLEVSEFGNFLFGKHGLDPFLEHPSSLWLIHWKLVTEPLRTTWYWAFNHFSSTTFDRDHLILGINRLVKDLNWRSIAATTIKNDVNCFIRTYVSAPKSSKHLIDDSFLESPLVELGLIKATGKRDGFRFVRGPKLSLGDGLFAYAVLEFWSKYSTHSTTLSFEAVAFAPGSPGRAFQLDENDVVDRLANIERVTQGKVRWSETAGLKQIVRDQDVDLENRLSLLRYDYSQSSRQRFVG